MAKRMDPITYILFGVLLAIGIMYLTGTGPFSTTGTGGGQGTAVVSSETVTVKANPVNFYAPAQSVTVEVMFRRPGTASPVVDDTPSNISLDAYPGEQFEAVAWDDGQTTTLTGDSVTLDSSADWYLVKETITVPEGVATYTWTPKLYKEGSATVTVYNENGTPNDSTTQQAIGTGETVVLKMELKGPNDASFGNPNSEKGIVVCFDYNTDVIKSIDVSNATAVAVPMQYSSTCEKAFELPVKAVKDLEKKEFLIEIEAKDDQDPADTHDITMYVLDPTAYIDSKTGEIKWGVEDDDGDDIGTSNVSATIYIS